MSNIKKLAKKTFRQGYRRWNAQKQVFRNTWNTAEIDLCKTYISGEGGFGPGTWADMTGEMKRASMLLAESPHVDFLEQYREKGQAIFQPEYFIHTPYYKNAMDCVRFNGEYFNHKTLDGIVLQGKSFVALYDRLSNNDFGEVGYAHPVNHSQPGSLPIVRRTWTPGVFQIDDGCHRLATYWVIGRKIVKVVALPESAPTELQSLVARASTERSAGEKGIKTLLQPIVGWEFDQTWTLLRRCADRFNMMQNFLSQNFPMLAPSSVLDLAASYGWFVAEFNKNGHTAMGVEANPAAAKIGRIAYGLGLEDMIVGHYHPFLQRCHRQFDVVLFLSQLHHYIPSSHFGDAKSLLQSIDRLTKKVLFLDMGEEHENFLQKQMSGWNAGRIVKFIQDNTSFRQVIPLGVDSDNVGRYAQQFGRTLFACLKS